MSKDHDKIAFRLASILQKLNQGETLVERELAEEFSVSVRTIQRDLRERFIFLPLEQTTAGYQLDQTYLGKFDLEDINRFAKFASVRELFGKIDQNFFQKYLNDSIAIKSYHVEPIAAKQREFDSINEAIQKNSYLCFTYQKVNRQDGAGADFEVEPYKLISKNGIWYLVAVHNEKIKVFSIARVRNVISQVKTFKPNPKLQHQIASSDSIYFEGTIDEVTVKVHANVAVYFTRRPLLPNQEIMQELTDGTLILKCKNVHEQEILPLVQYWLPNIEIVAPESLKQKLIVKLEYYLEKLAKRTESLPSN